MCAHCVLMQLFACCLYTKLAVQRHKRPAARTARRYSCQVCKWHTTPATCRQQPCPTYISGLPDRIKKCLLQSTHLLSASSSQLPFEASSVDILAGSTAGAVPARWLYVMQAALHTFHTHA
jgi:hypothetical protein